MTEKLDFSLPQKKSGGCADRPTDCPSAWSFWWALAAANLIVVLSGPKACSCRQ